MQIANTAADGRPDFRGGNRVNSDGVRAPASTGDVIQRSLEAFLLVLTTEVRVIRSIWPGLWPVAMPEGGLLRVLAWNVRIQPEDFIPQGAGVLRRARYVVLTVKDTGNGLTPGIQAALMAEEYAGAGLEASTVQRLAEVRETLLRHGGAVTFDASEYRGTRLNAYIPVTS